MYESRFLLCLLLTLLVACYSSDVEGTERSFTIDYENNCFLKDGMPFRYVSGSLHYFRVPEEFWKDRMTKMRAAGLNAIETYVEWSSHEPEPYQYNFSGNLNLVKFIQMAEEIGLVVILRVGPFIDAERDMGGLPYWLLRMKKDIALRTSDPVYTKEVDRWLLYLLPLMKPLLYSNGGPIIMAQVENNYGSFYACDWSHTTHLRDIFRKTLGNNVVLFTTDAAGASSLDCGTIDGVYATVEFGSGTDISAAFSAERTKSPKGPLVNSEYYTGWLDHWGFPHSIVSTAAVVKTLDEMLAVNASVNIYVFHGGTSFGFTSGSNLGGLFQSCPTSYDYDAPLTEAGDPTDKYYAIREVVGKYLPLPGIPLPTPSPKSKFGPIKLSPVQTIWDRIHPSSEQIVSQFPLTFEEIGQSQGFVIYQTKVNTTTSDPALLSAPGLRDRGYVFVDNVLQGILSRQENIYSLPILITPGQAINILVENQGRICFGKEINDFKGIIGDVTLGGNVLTNWTMMPIKLDDAVEKIHQILYSNLTFNSENKVPAFYGAMFILPQNATIYDTFLKFSGWYKGVVYINGHNLGRYWPIVGPQETLYVPSVYLKAAPEVNKIVLLELEHAPCSHKETCSVEFTDIPQINGKTPYKLK